MSFEDEIIEGSRLKEIDCSVKIVVIDNNIISVEGYQKIVSLSNESVVLKLKKFSLIEITGEGLEAKKLSKKEIIITGIIRGVNYV